MWLPDWMQTTDPFESKQFVFSKTEDTDLPTYKTRLKSGFWFENSYRDPDRIQTCDLLLRRQLLYSTELPDLKDGPQDKLKFKASCVNISH